MESTFNPLEMVEAIASDLGAEARKRKVHLLAFCAPELNTTIAGDRRLIYQLLYLLTENALRSVDHTKDGAVMVEALVSKSLNYDFVRLGVSDSRADVTIEEVTKIAAELEEQRIDGHSLKDLLEGLGSRLEPDFDLIGRATRVYFPLPIESNCIICGEPPLVDSVQDLSIFLVSNDPVPNRTIQYYAHYAGVDLRGAPTASETIIELSRANVQNQRFEILAIAPPIEDLSPIDLARAIRESDLKYIKLLYIAPWDDPVDRLKHMEAGFDDTIAKPFTKKQLFEAFERLGGRLPKKPEQRPVVLIAEDNPINAQLALFQLRKIGYDAVIVTNGKEALQALSSNDFVAVLMDLQMAVMDGIEATQKIRAEESKSNKHIPIIALTANDDRRNEALGAGCDLFLTKPAKVSDLENALRKLVKADERLIQLERRASQIDPYRTR